MVHDILDSIRSEGLVEGDGHEVEVVADHLGDKPLGAVERPDAEGPAVELGAAEDGVVEVHHAASKGVDALVDLAVCLPGVSAIGLCDRVVGAVTQQVLVLEAQQRCYMGRGRGENIKNDGSRPLDVGEFLIFPRANMYFRV